DAGAAPVAVPPPRMERTHEDVAVDGAAAEMRAEVRAVRVERVRRAVRAAEEDELGPEVAQRLHVAGREVVTPGDREPARRDREREPRCGHRAGSIARPWSPRTLLECMRSMPSAGTSYSGQRRRNS